MEIEGKILEVLGNHWTYVCNSHVFLIANLICCIYVYLFSYILFVYMCARISFQLVCVCVFIILFHSAHMLHHLNISAI